MHFDPKHFHLVMNYINYFAGQAKAVKTMTENKRSLYDISNIILASTNVGFVLSAHFYSTLYDSLIDLTNTLLEHPGLDDATRDKVNQIRVSAIDMELPKLAKTIEELEEMQKLLL